MKERGKKFLLKATEIDPGDKETYLLLCATELYSGNLEKAQKYAEKSLSISPKDVTGHFYLGSIASRRNDLDTAVKHYKRALEIQRTYYPAFAGLVETLEKAKRIEEAIEQYDRRSGNLLLIATSLFPTGTCFTATAGSKRP